MLTAREFCTARRSAGLELTSLPPALTAMLMSFATRANCFAMRSHRANIVCLRTSNMRPIGARILLDVPDRDCQIADVDVPGGPQEPVLAAVAPRFDVFREQGCVGTQDFERRAFRCGQAAGEARAADEGAPAFFLVVVEAERRAAARQRGEQFHAAQYLADQHDVAIQVAGRLADDDVQLRTAAGVGPVAARHADDAVAMRHPDLRGGLALDAGRESVQPAGPGCVAVGIR